MKRYLAGYQPPLSRPKPEVNPSLCPSTGGGVPPPILYHTHPVYVKTYRCSDDLRLLTGLLLFQLQRLSLHDHHL